MTASAGSLSQLKLSPSASLPLRAFRIEKHMLLFPKRPGPRGKSIVDLSFF